jgi:hypothetical protein
MHQLDRPVFVLVALLVVLSLTPARKTLRSRWFVVCVVLIVVLALPNILWEAPRGWPTLVWLHNDVTEGKVVPVALLQITRCRRIEWSFVIEDRRWAG